MPVKIAYDVQEGQEWGINMGVNTIGYVQDWREQFGLAEGRVYEVKALGGDPRGWAKLSGQNLKGHRRKEMQTRTDRTPLFCNGVWFTTARGPLLAGAISETEPPCQI